MIRIDVAQHEAAHIVVGVALGLPLIAATAIWDADEGALGWTWFSSSASERPALALMYAAGNAWEQMAGDPSTAIEDRRALRGMRYKPRGIRALTVAAGAILAMRAPAHAKVTRALLERGMLTGADISVLARGEWPGEEK